MQFEWESSPKLSTDLDYVVNYKCVHAYLCSGILPIQYIKFSKYANIGIPTRYTREKMISVYARSVETVKTQSLVDAVVYERAQTNAPDNSINIMSDARHACRKNSFHSDIPALGYKTHKVVAYSHITKEDERSSQKHELCGTKKLYDNFRERNIKIKIHVHDRNSSVSRYLADEQPECMDAYDTWHGSKEVKRGAAKITKGTKKTQNIIWHAQLAEKAALLSSIHKPPYHRENSPCVY